MGNLKKQIAKGLYLLSSGKKDEYIYVIYFQFHIAMIPNKTYFYYFGSKSRFNVIVYSYLEIKVIDT